MKKGTLFGTLLALVVVASNPLVSHARPADDTADKGPRLVMNVSSSGDGDERAAKIAHDVESKRVEIEQKLAEKRAAIQEKLSGKRAESCEKKQASINQILDNRVSAASKHLERFKAIQDKLVAFVEDKGLVLENATALELIMNDAQAAAQASVETAGVTDFACADTDAAAPGRIVTEQVSAQKEALKNYRGAIKDYAVAIKSALAATNPGTDGADQ